MIISCKERERERVRGEFDKNRVSKIEFQNLPFKMGFATNERLAADETFSPPRSRNSFLAFCKRSPFPEQNKGLSKKSAARIFLNKNIMQKIISAETLCRFKLKRQRSIVCRFFIVNLHRQVNKLYYLLVENDYLLFNGKYRCTAEHLFIFCIQLMLFQKEIYLLGRIQTSQTGGQLYSVILPLTKQESVFCLLGDVHQVCCSI